MSIFSIDAENRVLSSLNSSFSCDVIKGLLYDFITTELSNPSYPNIKKNRNEYLRSMRDLIQFLKDLTINDISWGNFCSLLPIVFENKTLGLFRDYLFREFYKFVINNSTVINEEINQLKKYNAYLDVPERGRIKWDIPIHPRIYNEVYLNFGLNRNPESLYLYEIPIISKTKSSHKTLINLNTDISFIKNLLRDYIESFPKAHNKRFPTLLLFRQFIYYFHKSLYCMDIGSTNLSSCKDKGVINHFLITDFNYNTFKHQFRFYSKIDERFPVTDEYKKSYGSYRFKLVDILKSFYIFLYNYIQIHNIDHNPFSGSCIDKELLLISLFNVYYQQGYYFITDSRLNNRSKRNRLAIIVSENSERARGAHQKIRSFDFTKLRYIKFKEDLFDYVFNSNYTLSLRNTDFHYLIHFLNYKYECDHQMKNVLNAEPRATFPEEFMFSYRAYVSNRYESELTMDRALQAVKHFLKYHKFKYNIGEYTQKYLTGFKRDRPGGKPIPINDFNLIMEKFRSIKGESLKNELSFIVFYICSTSKIRLGEVLNLQRDCIININENNLSGTVKYYSKGFDRNMKTEVIPITCITALQKAKELTDIIAQQSNTTHKKYIFILPSEKIKSNYSSRNTIYLGSTYNKIFKDVLDLAGLSKKYKPNQVRHTRKDLLYDEAFKAGFTELEVNEMLGGTMQVNLKHYIKKNKNELYIEAFTGVVISNVNINGQITVDNQYVDSLNNVNADIGSCHDKQLCKYTSLNDDVYKCLICNEFITCISRIETFKNEIISTKKQYEGSNSEYEKIFLESKLKLLGAYYKKLIDIISEEDE